MVLCERPFAPKIVRTVVVRCLTQKNEVHQVLLLLAFSESEVYIKPHLTLSYIFAVHQPARRLRRNV